MVKTTRDCRGTLFIIQQSPFRAAWKGEEVGQPQEGSNSSARPHVSRWTTALHLIRHTLPTSHQLNGLPHLQASPRDRSLADQKAAQNVFHAFITSRTFMFTYLGGLLQVSRTPASIWLDPSKQDGSITVCRDAIYWEGASNPSRIHIPYVCVRERKKDKYSNR